MVGKMGLKELKIKTTYRSFIDNIVEDFFVPCLKEGELYYRGVGYFTLEGLNGILEGIIPIVRKRGEVRIITSPMLLKEDIERVNNGEKLDDFMLSEILARELVKPEDDYQKIGLNLLSKLIINNIIQIKIAYLSNGIYHEKIGIIKDREGDIIAFNGSTNETKNAQFKNLESFTVLKSWKDKDAIDESLEYFNRLWNDEIEQLSVLTLPEAIKKKMVHEYEASDSLEDAIEKYQNIIMKKIPLPQQRGLYEFQKNAINEFMQNRYCHFFEMATGTGKTFTAIQTIKELLKKEKAYVMILVPQVDLQNQWFLELKREGFENISLFGGDNIHLDDWVTTFNKTLIEYKISNIPIISISIYDSFFAKVVNRVDNIENLFLIIDEAHNISENQFKKLPTNAVCRLGLSATPEKHNKWLTEEIVSYFTRDNVETFKYTIEEAINSNFLSRYNYYPIFVHLNEDEFGKYKVLSKKLAALINAKEKNQDFINTVANNRSIIIKKAVSKTEKLIEMILDKENYNFKNSVIYCGQGKNGESEDKLIDVVMKALNDFGEYRVSSFTSETDMRSGVLKYFEEGYYDTLVALKCFDEGIDVPKLDKIFIMSSDKLKRQTIQRRGRVLRKCIESGKKIAYIYDLVVLPPEKNFEGSSAASLIKMEFQRVKEYMRLSENRLDYEQKIATIESNFGIQESDVQYDEEQDF